MTSMEIFCNIDFWSGCCVTGRWRLSILGGSHFWKAPFIASPSLI